LLKTPIIVTPTATDNEIVFSFKLTASFTDAPLDLLPPGARMSDGGDPRYFSDQTLTGTIIRRASKVCPRGGLHSAVSISASRLRAA
jgi:hypothetical protein